MKNPRTNLACLLATASLAFAPVALAVDPPPDGGYANQNTAEGEDALFSLTTGFDNTAIGYHALHQYTTGSENTAVGTNALAMNTAPFVASNTAIGAEALSISTTGNSNTAVGFNSLGQTTTGRDNTAIGWQALYQNITGTNNIALGLSAGGLCKLSNNIMIGNAGNIRDSGAIRIGVQGTQIHAFMAGISGATVAGGVGVIVDANGQLGTITSSARYKEAIRPMNKASEAVLSLQPVTFRYKHELDPAGIPQFGLVAEQVAKVDPDLVARDDQGKPYTVRYEAVNAMLLNEFLKAHSRIEEQGKEIAELKAALKQQAAQIQRVNAQLEPGKSLVLTINDNQ